jgi:hypothetical protein
MTRPPPSPPAAPRSQVVVQLTSQRVDLRDQRLTPGAGSCTTTPRSSAMGSDRHSVTQGRLAGLRETPAPEGLWSRALGGRDAALTAGRQLQPVPSAVSGAFRELIVALLLVLRLQTSLSTAGSQRWPLAGSAQRPAIYKFGGASRWVAARDAAEVAAHSTDAAGQFIECPPSRQRHVHDNIRRTRTTVRRRHAHTDTGPATRGAHGSPVRRRQAHTDRRPSDVGHGRIAARRRRAHTEAGPATSGAHGGRPSDVGRTRRPARRR